MKQLNAKLEDLYLEKLEERLETDPMSIVAFLEIEDSNAEPNCLINFCRKYINCPELASCSPVM